MILQVGEFWWRFFWALGNVGNCLRKFGKQILGIFTNSFGLQRLSTVLSLNQFDTCSENWNSEKCIHIHIYIYLYMFQNYLHNIFKRIAIRNLMDNCPNHRHSIQYSKKRSKELIQPFKWHSYPKPSSHIIHIVPMAFLAIYLRRKLQQCRRWSCWCRSPPGKGEELKSMGIPGSQNGATVPKRPYPLNHSA